jgi:formamidopyrimidine-DNA glycosylase
VPLTTSGKAVLPELPDVQVYVERLAALVRGETLERIRIAKPFLLRSVTPPVRDAEGRRVVSVQRIGKRIAVELEGDIFLVIHLMIAGRLRWREAGKKLGGKLVLAEFTFAHGTLYLTEAGTKRRAMLHVVSGAAGLEQFDRGGLEVLTADAAAFSDRLRSENHTLKRALTDPRLFSGIGNAYSDEILHRARLSPLALTQKLDEAVTRRLFEATLAVLREWTERLRADVGDGFPEEVTAFRPEMAVHGRFGQPCPVCGAPVQRIRYADNETNYCARCQTGGRLLADRAFSRLLKDDWPRSIDDVE